MVAEEAQNENQLQNAAAKLAKDLDCGDGVPALKLDARNPGQDDGSNLGRGGPKVTAKVFGLVATVFGQLLIGLAVLAGGSAMIGGFASVLLVACGLAMVMTDVVNAG